MALSGLWMFEVGCWLLDVQSALRLNSGQTNAVEPTARPGVVAGMASGPGKEYRGKTSVEYEENTKETRREYERNTKATR
jgi:hypothetical protein